MIGYNHIANRYKSYLVIFSVNKLIQVMILQSMKYIYIYKDYFGS